MATVTMWIQACQVTKKRMKMEGGDRVSLCKKLSSSSNTSGNSNISSPQCRYVSRYWSLRRLKLFPGVFLITLDAKTKHFSSDGKKPFAFTKLWEGWFRRGKNWSSEVDGRRCSSITKKGKTTKLGRIKRAATSIYTE